MANNRMFIKCLHCNEKRMIAKYYPDTGWYFECLDGPKGVMIGHLRQLPELLGHLCAFVKKESPGAFNKWLDEHRHDNFSFEGPTHFELIFEIT